MGKNLCSKCGGEVNGKSFEEIMQERSPLSCPKCGQKKWFQAFSHKVCKNCAEVFDKTEKYGT